MENIVDQRPKEDNKAFSLGQFWVWKLRELKTNSILRYFGPSRAPRQDEKFMVTQLEIFIEKKTQRFSLLMNAHQPVDMAKS